MSVAIPEQETVEEPTLAMEPVWSCIVWDDPVNLMTYVTYVFQTAYSGSKALPHAGAP